MFDSDWRPNVAIGALVALVSFSAFASYESSVGTRQGASETVQQQYPQQAACDPQADNYYNCMDLAAQEGMREATDTLAAQGDAQLALGITNLALLILTLSASITATLIAARAVKVARMEMENGLQPRLGANIPQCEKWDPTADDPWGSENFLPDSALTQVSFHNYGEASAFLVMVWGRHYWRDDKDGFPPPFSIAKLRNSISLPEGNWVKKDADSQTFDLDPIADVAEEAPAKTNDRTWYVIGCVAYEGLHGVRYLTRYCFFFDKTDKAWYLGPGDWPRRSDYNRTERLDSKWRARIERQILFDSQT